MTEAQQAARRSASAPPMSRQSNLGRVVLLWISVRVALSLWAFVVASSGPAAPIDEQFAVWQAQMPQGQVEQLLLAPWYRWDVEHFASIANRGYRIDDGTLSFHPLYPLLGWAVSAVIGGHVMWGLFLVSNVSSLLFLLVLDRLARLDLSNESALRACVYFLMLPAAFAMFAPYTEALFLLCSCACLLMARRGRWWMAGLLGALAVLTRQQGVLLLLPLAWELCESAGRRWRTLRTRWREASALLLIPAALAAWVVFRKFALGDARFEWREPYSLIYGLFISPSAQHVISTQSVTFPWTAITVAVTRIGPTNGIDLVLGGSYLAVLVLGGRLLWRLRPSYFLYAAATVVASFSLSTGVPYGYMGLARHCLLAFPLAFILAASTRQQLVVPLMVGLGVIGLLVLPALYVLKILWVP